jgi:hypothetical protein
MTALTSGFRPGRRGPGRTPHVKEAQRRSALQPGLDPVMESQELNDELGAPGALTLLRSSRRSGHWKAGQTSR